MTILEAREHVDQHLHRTYRFIRFYGYNEDYIHAQVVRISNGDLTTFIIDFKNHDVIYEEE